MIPPLADDLSTKLHGLPGDLAALKIRVDSILAEAHQAVERISHKNARFLINQMTSRSWDYIFPTLRMAQKGWVNCLETPARLPEFIQTVHSDPRLSYIFECQKGLHNKEAVTYTFSLPVGDSEIMYFNFEAFRGRFEIGNTFLSCNLDSVPTQIKAMEKALSSRVYRNASQAERVTLRTKEVSKFFKMHSFDPDSNVPLDYDGALNRVCVMIGGTYLAFQIRTFSPVPQFRTDIN